MNQTDAIALAIGGQHRFLAAMIGGPLAAILAEESTAAMEYIAWLEGRVRGLEFALAEEQADGAYFRQMSTDK